MEAEEERGCLGHRKAGKLSVLFVLGVGHGVEGKSELSKYPLHAHNQPRPHPPSHMQVPVLRG